MAYSKPNAFTPTTVVDAVDVQGNFDALRVYLHDGVIGPDLQTSSQWVDIQHIQQPVIDPYLGLQHGVTGWQGGQSSGGPLVRATFSSSFMTGAKSGSQDWIPVPQTAIKIQVRKPGTLVFHYMWDVIVGPDDGFAAGSGGLPAEEYRVVYVAPYFGGPSSVQGTDMPRIAVAAQETVNNRSGWVNLEKSPAKPYERVGFGSKDGTLVRSLTVGEYIVGMCSFSEVDRVAFLNWSTSIEFWYI
jgi:hypothetical protein